jgi:hypothetical protein
VIGRFGIPDTVCTDGGPQFKWEFQEFLKEFNINHRVSSPHYAQSNKAVEAAVKVAKNLIKKNGLQTKQLQLALLAYRSTPLECGFFSFRAFVGQENKNLCASFAFKTK